ncbi:hypothetical protein D5F01_LYC10143 [Larimichthys crocea]|uniref:Uncharacterized protein n=1 Tax=Larimichthys crocea TaxID=215358 RepID=A0A6G0IG88_LARCR|nr:hypothetical protein D5F01_LYC10143 [Larimichthys crocea]
MENLTPENPKYMEPKISERARSCHKDNTNDIVDKSCKQKLFFDEFNEEKVDKVIEADLKGTFETNKLPKIDTFPDIFSRSSQGPAMTKNSLKIKKKKCGKTIDDILGSAEPFEEKTEKKRKNKKTVDKFQEDVEKDFDWLSISNSHTLLSKEKKRFDQMVFQKQTSAEPDTFLKNQLREASANSERLTYDMQTLRMDNADIRAKFSATEAEFDKLKSKYTSLSERYQEMMLEKMKPSLRTNIPSQAPVQGTEAEVTF